MRSSKRLASERTNSTAIGIIKYIRPYHSCQVNKITVPNLRLDFIEKETLRLVRSYEIIGVENLNLQGISGFLRNAKTMTDTSWGIFVNKLTWKASKNEHNCQIIKVSRHFPSSKLCSKCGFQYKELKLSERKWVCLSCGTEHNRDLNAAINLKGESIRLAKSELRPVEDCLSKRNRKFPGNLGSPVKQETGIFQGV
jgi:putative transposase